MTNSVAEKNVDVLNALTAWNERVGDGDRLSRVDSGAIARSVSRWAVGVIAEFVSRFTLRVTSSPAIPDFP